MRVLGKGNVVFPQSLSCAGEEIPLDLREVVMLLGINAGSHLSTAELLSSLIVRQDGRTESVH